MTPEPWLFLHNGLGRWALIMVFELYFQPACLEMKYPLLLHLIVLTNSPLLLFLHIQLFIPYTLISCKIISSPSPSSQTHKNTQSLTRSQKVITEVISNVEKKVQPWERCLTSELDRQINRSDNTRRVHNEER